MEWSSVFALAGVGLGALLSSRLQRSNAHTSMLGSARIEAYTTISTALHLYRKANLDRHHLRLQGKPEGESRQAAYDRRAETHAALNRVDLLSRTKKPPRRAREAKAMIDNMTEAPDKAALDECNREFMARMERFTQAAREDTRVEQERRLRPGR